MSAPDVPMPNRGGHMDEALGKLARRQWGVFTRAQAVENGATKWTVRRRLAQSKWLEVARGVYRFPGGNASWQQKVLASTLSISGAMASHRTAAYLWGLECLNGAPALIDVAVAFGTSRRLTLARVHVTRRLPSKPVLRDGIATTPLARTLIDLGDVLSEEMLFVAFDSARRKFRNIIPELEKELTAGGPGRRKTEVLAAMVERSKGEPPTGSPFEARTAFKLDRRRGLLKPTRQHHIYDENGNFIARVDFAWIQQRVVIQCDSRKWHLTAVAFEKDLLQRRQLESNGWRVLHVTSQMLANDDWLVDLERLVSTQGRFALEAHC
jgi:very-short-patch-repair endonuclease